MPTGTNNLLRKRVLIADNIAAAIREKIDDGQYKSGEMLPSRSKLAREYGVALETMQQAFTKLVEQGVVRSESRRGTFVASSHRRAAPAALNVSTRTASPAASDLRVGVIWRSHRVEEGMPEGGSGAAIARSVYMAIANFGAASASISVPAGDNMGARVANAIDEVVAQGANALMLVTVDEADLSEGGARRIAELNIPAVAAGYEDVRLPIRHVYYDMRNSGLQAARHLIDQGCDDLVYASCVEFKWAMERLQGVRDAIANFAMPSTNLRTAALRRVSAKIRWNEAASEAAAPLLPSLSPTSGVIACNDKTAYGFIGAARASGLEPGIDYRIIGFDDDPLSAEMGLSTIPPPLDEIGREAAKMLVALAAGVRGPMRISIQSGVVARRSTRADFAAALTTL